MKTPRCDVPALLWLVAMSLGSIAGGALAQDPAKPAPTPSRTAALENRYRPGHPVLVAEVEAQAVEEELRKQLAAAEGELKEIRAKMRAVNGNRPVEGLR